MKPLSITRSVLTVHCALAVMLALPLARPATAAEPQRDASPAAQAAAVAVPPPVLPGTWQLAGFDPGLGSADLEPLRKLVGKAQIVGLGESHATSGGFQQMRFRVTRYLVEKLGFRVFAIESAWVEAQQTAAFVASCEGSADEALLNLYPTWASVEMRELALWMCDWNQSHPKAKDKIRFTGIDTHDQAAADAAALTAFLLTLGWAEDDPRIAGLAECQGVVTHDTAGHIPQARYDACIGSLDAISQYFAANVKTIVRKTSKADLEWAKVRLVALRTEENNIYYPGDSRSWAARNEGLAYNVVKLRDLLAPKAKVVVWSNNTSVSKGGPGAPPWDYVTMGTLLRQSQGKNYLAIALAADETDIDWDRVGCGPVAAYGRPGSYEQALHDLGLGDLLVDLRANGVVPGVLPEGDHALGEATIDIRSRFDALLYLDVSPKMNPLAWPPCP